MALLTKLPLDIISVIFDKIGSYDILKSAQYVCKEWYDLAKDPITWRRINGNQLDFKYLKIAVDRSCRGLIEYAAPEVPLVSRDLEYIFERSPQLEMLSFQCNGWLHPFLKEVFTKASKCCPFLKDIGISIDGYNFQKDDIECIGSLFPNLEKFRLKKNSNFGLVRSIARNMSGLLELQLDMGDIVDDDFRAILVGCPRLQFLGVIAKSSSKSPLLLDDDPKEKLKRILVCEIYVLYDNGLEFFFEHGETRKEWRSEIRNL